MSMQAETKVIVSPDAIRHHLYELLNDKQPLKLNFAGIDELKDYQSTIQKIDDENKLCYLRMFRPQSQAMSGHLQTVDVKSSPNSGNLNFLTELTAQESPGVPEICRFRFPDTLFINQKRSSYRVPLRERDAKIKLDLGQEETNLLIGICHDFSMGGTLCQLDEYKETALETGMTFEFCQVEIQSLISFICKAELCHIKSLKNGQKQVGLKFVDLPTTLLNRISRVIAQIQRNNIRGLVKLDLPSNPLPLID